MSKKGLNILLIFIFLFPLISCQSGKTGSYEDDFMSRINALRGLGHKLKGNASLDKAAEAIANFLVNEGYDEQINPQNYLLAQGYPVCEDSLNCNCEKISERFVAFNDQYLPEDLLKSMMKDRYIKNIVLKRKWKHLGIAYLEGRIGAAIEAGAVVVFLFATDDC